MLISLSFHIVMHGFDEAILLPEIVWEGKIIFSAGTIDNSQPRENLLLPAS